MTVSFQIRAWEKHILCLLSWQSRVWDENADFFLYTVYAEAAVSLKQIRSAPVRFNVKMRLVPKLLKHTENQAKIYIGERSEK